MKYIIYKIDLDGLDLDKSISFYTPEEILKYGVSYLEGSLLEVATVFINSINYDEVNTHDAYYAVLDENGKKPVDAPIKDPYDSFIFQQLFVEVFNPLHKPYDELFPIIQEVEVEFYKSEISKEDTSLYDCIEKYLKYKRLEINRKIY
mgnify:CR=1 FL=1